MNDEGNKKPEATDMDLVFRRTATDFDRVEMLAVALDAFAHPVPDYDAQQRWRAAQYLLPRTYSSPSSSRRCRSDASE